MTTFNDKTDLTARCDDLLGKSNLIYRQAYGLYQSLSKEIGDRPEQVQHTMTTINSLYQEAKTVDDLTAEMMSKLAPLPESTKVLLQNREARLAELQAITRNLKKKANNISSLLQHEIKNMSTGRTALQGYGKTAITSKKNIVKGAF